MRDSGYYVGTHKGYLTSVPFYLSDLFGERVSSKSPGFVNVTVSGPKSKVWNVSTKDNNLFYYPINDGQHQQFIVSHLQKDVVVIRSKLHGLCVDYSGDKIHLEKCNTAEDYKNQVFFITDKNLGWHGFTNYRYLMKYYPDHFDYGNCSYCLRGGFGAEDYRTLPYQYFGL